MAAHFRRKLLPFAFGDALRQVPKNPPLMVIFTMSKGWEKFPCSAAPSIVLNRTAFKTPTMHHAKLLRAHPTSYALWRFDNSIGVIVSYGSVDFMLPAIPGNSMQGGLCQEPNSFGDRRRQSPCSELLLPS
ncbi:hypothetical protein EDEG_00722 [Edhazardia aedis USNM 41457]|uniref:Uncharacterized protein n=1 Tax=Edhazardia aedis (strain USNM 41457) TaxID=1003232 RepID=J9DRJ8_EDHAE|nr:hypothetical protein EDEG_00722 [Edhazardia aedis USNM 41457]|eukprot:EJW05190.1 hypothetical protein EDEG_00722 [Edhazardia aedis USNM 41457]